MQKQREDIEAKLKQLEEIRSSISNRLDEKVKVDEDRVNKLVEVYKNMKPGDAAKILEKLEDYEKVIMSGHRD